jgi:bifunctional non-homologous end joining protein LigD
LRSGSGIRTPRFVDHRAIGAYPMAPMPLYSRALPPGFIAPCLPTSAPQPPSGAVWLHEIKHDGFRVIARKIGKRVEALQPAGQ